MLVQGSGGIVSQPGFVEFASKCAIQPGLYFDTVDQQTIASRIAKELGGSNGDFAVSFDATGCLGGVACLTKSEFDSAIFEMKMGAIRHLYASGTAVEQAAAVADVLSNLVNHAKAAGFRHLMARVPSSGYQAVHALEQHGFRTMGVQVTLAMKGSAVTSTANQSSHGVAIRPFIETDLPFLEQLSADAYTESRFFADPHLPAEAAQQLHRLWIANDCHGRAAQVLVAETDSVPAGYLACLLHRPDEDKESHIGDIDLVAVSPAARGKGIGWALVSAALQWFKPRTDYIIVKTQVTNYGAIALYHRAGFRLVQAHTTLHAKL